jgi:hypothetical protein
VGPDEAEGGANLPTVDLAGELNLTIEAIEIGGGDQVERFFAGASKNNLVASSLKGMGDILAERLVNLDDEDRGAGRLGRRGIHDRILQLRSRSSAQGQEKESDIASGDPLARGARTLRQG